MTWISRDYQDSDFPHARSLEDKIKIFQNRVAGWQLDIGEKVLEIPHAGYGAIAILFSYFEMIAEYQTGQSSEGQSALFFVHGFRSVYPSTSLTDPEIRWVYKMVRNGMYHSGMTKSGTLISGDYREAVAVKSSWVLVNPHILVQDVRGHFDGYVAMLRDPKNANMREDFEARLDVAETMPTTPQPPGPVGPSGPGTVPRSRK
jgi:hypothetical protein